MALFLIVWPAALELLNISNLIVGPELVGKHTILAQQQTADNIKDDLVNIVEHIAVKELPRLTA